MSIEVLREEGGEGGRRGREEGEREREGVERGREGEREREGGREGKEREGGGGKRERGKEDGYPKANYTLEIRLTDEFNPFGP